MTDNYDDIINLPHHVSKTHPQMTMYQRAAQFAPFAALVGHDAMISETARLTDEEVEMEDEAVKILNRRMAYLNVRMQDHPVVTITYFIHDKKKSGGEYKSHTGTVRKIDEYDNSLTMSDGTVIPFISILDIDGEIFNDDEFNGGAR